MNGLDLVYIAAAGVTAPWWARKARGGWRGRRGFLDVQLPEKRRGVTRVLLHAVSVGETNAIRGLVPMLAGEFGCEVVVSAWTDTGLARSRELYERMDRVWVVRYPLDFSRCVRRFLDAVKPDVVGLVELEMWPNFSLTCRRRGVPVCVINGRLSERSFKGYLRARPVLKGMFGALAAAGVQDEAYAERFRAMGTPANRVVVTGSMKWDSVAMADEVEGAEELAREMGIDRSRPLIVAGSTAPGEDRLLDEACPEGVQLLCAPRKPEWFDGAYTDLGGEGRCVRRSVVKSGGAGARGGRDRFLLDTIGELRKAYSLADVAVVGRSFGELYGSDPIEPAALGKAVVIGPAVSDFANVVAAFEAGGGIVRATRESLKGELERLISDAGLRRTLGERARACIRAQQGATRRHAEMLMGAVGKRM